MDGSKPMRVAVAMSGGVDSSAAALLCRRAGHDVIGFFLRNGVRSGGGRSCCSESDAADARLVADRLGIPFYVLDVEAAFSGIIDRFVRAYEQGRTPNPCIECNARVKFGRLLEVARAVGAGRVVTGHYARLKERGGRMVLSRAVDRAKDQSYVLATLDQEQLRRASFPLGALDKAQVRRLAAEAGLAVADKAESQEICFVPSGDYRDLLRERATRPAAAGDLVSATGEVLGRHAGIAGFTVGQRRGLGVARGRRQFVIRIEPEGGRVVVGDRDEAAARRCHLREVRWGAEPAPAGGARRPVIARIRHRHAGAPAWLESSAPGRAVVEFEQPEFAVTPGQAAVLYVGDDVLAAGIIERVEALASRSVERPGGVREGDSESAAAARPPDGTLAPQAGARGARRPRGAGPALEQVEPENRA